MTRALSLLLLFTVFTPWSFAQTKPREIHPSRSMLNLLRLSQDSSLCAVSYVHLRKLPDGREGGDGNGALVLDVKTGVTKLDTGKNHLEPLGFTTDNKSLVMGGKWEFDLTTIQVWDLESGKPSPKVVLKKSTQAGLRLLNDKIFSMSSTGNMGKYLMETWDLTGKQLESFELDLGGRPTNVQRTPDALMVIAVDAKLQATLVKRDAKTGKTTRVPLGGIAGTAIISDDGKWIVGNDTKALKLLDATGKQRWAVPGKFGYPSYARVVGKQVISSTPGGMISIFDQATGRLVRSITTDNAEVTYWLPLPNGALIATCQRKNRLNFGIDVFDLAKLK